MSLAASSVSTFEACTSPPPSAEAAANGETAGTFAGGTRSPGNRAASASQASHRGFIAHPLGRSAFLTLGGRPWTSLLRVVEMEGVFEDRGLGEELSVRVEDGQGPDPSLTAGDEVPVDEDEEFDAHGL